MKRHIKKLTFAFAIFSLFSQTVLADWKPTNGPCPWGIKALTLSGPNIIACANLYGENSRIFISTDDGITWQIVYELPLVYVNNKFNCLTSASGIVFAGAYSGIFCSSNNGLTWAQDTSLIAGYSIYSLGFNNNILFAGTTQGIYISDNNGKNWALMNNSPRNVSCFAFIDTLVFSGNANGIYLSRDNGINWSLQNTGLPTLHVVNDIIVKNDSLFAAIWGGVYLSTNSGNNWTSISNGLPKADINALLFQGSQLFAGTDSGIYSSTNNGLTWVEVHPGLLSDRTSIQSLALFPTGIITGTDKGIFIHQNNGNWIESNYGMTDIYFNGISSENGILLAGGSRYSFLSNNNGNGWIPLSTGLPDTVNITCVKIHRNTLLLGTYDSGIFRSMDNGDSWQAINSGLDILPIKVIASKDSTLFTATEKIVTAYLSNDNKNPWVRTCINLLDGRVSSFAVNDRYIFMGTEGAIFTPFYCSVFSSSDNGNNWVKADSGIPQTSYTYIRALAACGGALIAGMSSGQVFISNNNGAYWTPGGWIGPSGSNSSAINSFAVYEGTIFAGTNGRHWDGGIYVSIDTGKTWNANNTGFSDSCYINKLEISGNNLFACGGNRVNGMWYDGIWSRSISEMLPVNVHSHPKFFSRLGQNNNISIVNQSNNFIIKLNLSNSSNIEIKILKYNGQEIETPFIGQLGPGIQNLKIDATKLACGMYILNVKIGINNHLKSFAIFH